MHNIRKKRDFDQEKKSLLGQVMTPDTIADYMASFFDVSTELELHILDAGAGKGALSSALIKKFLKENTLPPMINLTAYEIDHAAIQELKSNLAQYTEIGIQATIKNEDYLDSTLDRSLYTHAILNPPYKKINNTSSAKFKIRSIGIDTVNFYTAFVWLAINQLKPGGQLVAIIPRSFCNGPYYKPFREKILQETAIQRIHLFESRRDIFKSDNVLQENVIIHLKKNKSQEDVLISSSNASGLKNVIPFKTAHSKIIFAGDSEKFIHIPAKGSQEELVKPSFLSCTLEDLGLQVSTGPVVDFRLKDHLSNSPSIMSAPLIYPASLREYEISWPLTNHKKSMFIESNSYTQKYLHPNDHYCLVRRFSSKEEKRRINASVIEPKKIKGYPMVGFENHINVFHINKRGLPELLAKGLAVYLSTTIVDRNFRSFNGHTQVNATDLRKIKYPSLRALLQLGEWFKTQKSLTQETIDRQFNAISHA